MYIPAKPAPTITASNALVCSGLTDQDGARADGSPTCPSWSSMVRYSDKNDRPYQPADCARRRPRPRRHGTPSVTSREHHPTAVDHDLSDATLVQFWSNLRLK
jgi:hypothetical protein